MVRADDPEAVFHGVIKGDHVPCGVCDSQDDVCGYMNVQQFLLAFDGIGTSSSNTTTSTRGSTFPGSRLRHWAMHMYLQDTVSKASDFFYN